MNLDKYEAIRNRDWAKVREIEAQEKKQELAEAIEELPRDKTDTFTDLIKDYVRLERWIASLQQEKEELLDEHYKDNKIQEMQKKYNEMRCDLNRGFPISEKESRAIRKWIDNHEKEHSGGHGCCGGKYTYIFIPTSLGTIGTIKCSCGASFDFQEL